MNKQIKLVLIGVFKHIGLVIISFFLFACHHSDAYQGYIEGKYVYLSAPLGGRLQILAVEKGGSVKKNQLIFSLDQEPEFANVQQSLANVNSAGYNLADLKLGERPSELAAIEAQIAQAKANLVFSEQTLKRYQVLYQKNLVEKQVLDQYTSKVKANQAVVDSLSENLKTAQLSARVNQVRSASAKVDAAAAHLESSQWSLAQKTVYAPDAGIVYDTYYRIGEEVNAYQPVISLLLLQKSRIIFYVPETVLSQIKVNQAIKISCDGDNHIYPAVVTYISDAAEYTPPIIYSRTTRSKLVYRVEAKFSDKNHPLPLKPGQPVDVALN
jgi:HlyD family secretion protein